MVFDRPKILHKVNFEIRLMTKPQGKETNYEEHVSPPQCSLFIAAYFMKPLELRASSWCFRDEGQLQPWCEDNRIHLFNLRLCSVAFEMGGAVD